MNTGGYKPLTGETAKGGPGVASVHARNRSSGLLEGSGRSSTSSARLTFIYSAGLFDYMRSDGGAARRGTSIAAGARGTDLALQQWCRGRRKPQPLGTWSHHLDVSLFAPALRCGWSEAGAGPAETPHLRILEEETGRPGNPFLEFFAGLMDGPQHGIPRPVDGMAGSERKRRRK